MKNKKLLTRIFALLASLVLVVALAVPCFAAETDQPPTDYIYKRVYSYDELIAYFNFDNQAFPCIVKERMDSDTYFNGDAVFTTSVDSVFVYWRYGDLYGLTNYELHITDNTDTFELIVSVYPVDEDPSSSTYELTWSDFELYVLVPVSSDSSTDPSAPSSDMYSNLFNILKDAVYGLDVELTGSQEYALTLISTILTYATILLPVIIVIIIVAWCFKRF